MRWWPELLIMVLTPVVMAGMVHGGLLSRVGKEGAMLLFLAGGNGAMAGWIACHIVAARRSSRSA
jgi:hypothetical protein